MNELGLTISSNVGYIIGLVGGGLGVIGTSFGIAKIISNKGKKMGQILEQLDNLEKRQQHISNVAVTCDELRAVERRIDEKLDHIKEKVDGVDNKLGELTSILLNRKIAQGE